MLQFNVEDKQHDLKNKNKILDKLDHEVCRDVNDENCLRYDGSFIWCEI